MLAGQRLKLAALLRCPCQCLSGSPARGQKSALLSGQAGPCRLRLCQPCSARDALHDALAPQATSLALAMTGDLAWWTWTSQGPSTAPRMACCITARDVRGSASSKVCKLRLGALNDRAFSGRALHVRPAQRACHSRACAPAWDTARGTNQRTPAPAHKKKDGAPADLRDALVVLFSRTRDAGLFHCAQRREGPKAASCLLQMLQCHHASKCVLRRASKCSNKTSHVCVGCAEIARHFACCG